MPLSPRTFERKRNNGTAGEEQQEEKKRGKKQIQLTPSAPRLRAVITALLGARYMKKLRSVPPMGTTFPRTTPGMVVVGPEEEEKGASCFFLDSTSLPLSFVEVFLCLCHEKNVGRNGRRFFFFSKGKRKTAATEKSKCFLLSVFFFAFSSSSGPLLFLQRGSETTFSRSLSRSRERKREKNRKAGSWGQRTSRKR